jgi:hypothetical protein
VLAPDGTAPGGSSPDDSTTAADGAAPLAPGSAVGDAVAVGNPLAVGAHAAVAAATIRARVRIGTVRDLSNGIAGLLTFVGRGRCVELEGTTMWFVAGFPVRSM